MVAGPSNTDVEASLSAPPSFSVAGPQAKPLIELFERAHLTAPMATIDTTIDMRNLFPQRRNINVTVWQTVSWQCEQQRESQAACEAKQAMLVGSPFAQQLQGWLREQRAELNFRVPFLGQCSTGGGPPAGGPAAAASSFVPAIDCDAPDAATASCINQKRYCHPDPDGQPGFGTTGRDALIDLLRRKCINQVAQQFLQPQAFLFYLEDWLARCEAAADFSEDCALSAFQSPSVLPSWSPIALEQTQATREGILEEVRICFAANTQQPDEDAPNALLEADVAGDGGVVLEPTVVVNGVQVRGAYLPSTMVAALCSAFQDGSEPASCADFGSDACAPGGEGAVACATGQYATAARTRCVPRFNGYDCECELDQVRQQITPTDAQLASSPSLTAADFYVCVPRNECAPELATCDAGVCLALPEGGHRCVASLAEQCTAANSYGGCYVSNTLEAPGGDAPLTACQSNIAELERRGREGDATIEAAAAYECDCALLPCHAGDGVRCEARCPLEECLLRDTPQQSSCLDVGRGAGGSESLSTAALAGIIAGIAALLLAVGALAAWRLHRSNREGLSKIDSLIRQLRTHSDLDLPRQGPSGERGAPAVATPGAAASRSVPFAASTEVPSTATSTAAGVAPWEMYMNAAFSNRLAEPGSESSYFGDSAPLPIPLSRAHAGDAGAGASGQLSGPVRPMTGGTGVLSVASAGPSTGGSSPKPHDVSPSGGRGKRGVRPPLWARGRPWGGAATARRADAAAAVQASRGIAEDLSHSMQGSSSMTSAGIAGVPVAAGGGAGSGAAASGGLSGLNSGPHSSGSTVGSPGFVEYARGITTVPEDVFGSPPSAGGLGIESGATSQDLYTGEATGLPAAGAASSRAPAREPSGGLGGTSSLSDLLFTPAGSQGGSFLSSE